MRSGHQGGSRLAIVTVLIALVTLVAPGAAFAQNGQIKLALVPVGQAGSYFDLVMEPGESQGLDVRISNSGDAAILARTYAADVYTIVNGGFGGRLRGESQTGMTRWLDYATEVLELRPGKGADRTFAVAVPADAEPGEYITSLVLENDQPIRGSGSIALDQIVRQAIAVVVTVPGERSPALEVGDATHKVVAGRSIVSVAVHNPGNVRLKPLVELTLLDARGGQVSQATVQMGTFYAHTDTFVEMPLEALLLPGDYTVRVSLEDAGDDIRTSADAIFVVDAPPQVVAAAGDAGGLTAVVQGVVEGQVSIPVWGLVLLAVLVLTGATAGLLILGLRRRRRTPTP